MALNDGAVKLDRATHGTTRAVVGAALGVSGQMVSNYVSGRKIPSWPVQARALELYGIETIAWARPPTAAAGVSDASPTPAASLTARANGMMLSPERSRGLSAYRRALLNVERSEAILGEMRAKDASPRELAAVMSAVNSSLNALTRAEPFQVKILGSHEWQRIEEELGAALRGHPEAAKAVGEAFSRLDREMLGEIIRALGPEPEEL